MTFAIILTRQAVSLVPHRHSPGRGFYLTVDITVDAFNQLNKN